MQQIGYLVNCKDFLGEVDVFKLPSWIAYSLVESWYELSSKI